MSEIVSETLREIGPGLNDGGSYTVIGIVRENDRSRLYLAERAGKRYVLKAPASDSGLSLELLKREWEVSIGLSHSSLAYVFTWEESSPVGPCMVQEYVDGRSLKDYLEEKPSKESRRRVFRQILSAVGYLHGKGVIHNDLSPSNILISRADDAVKIIDLGFADDSTHFLAKSLGGTRDYASPELQAGLPVDARSDIYSLGVLLRLVFPGRYGRIVRRCLNGDPAKRYASVDALARAIKGYWKPLKAAVYVAIVLILAVLAFVWQRSVLSRASVGSQIDSLKIDSLENTIGSMNHIVDSLTMVLDEIEAEKVAQQQELESAKANVDTWFSREVPAFRRALKSATTQKEINDAWAVLANKYVELNSEIIRNTPPPAQSIAINYMYDKYNSVFPGLQVEIANRLNEL